MPIIGEQTRPISFDRRGDIWKSFEPGFSLDGFLWRQHLFKGAALVNQVGLETDSGFHQKSRVANQGWVDWIAFWGRALALVVTVEGSFYGGERL